MKTLQRQPLRLNEAYVFNDGKLYRVGLLNASRARLDPLWRKRHAIVSRLHDIRREVLTTPPSVSISPGSLLYPAKR